MSSSSALAASVLRSPPCDKSTSNRLRLFVFPLSQLESSRPYAADQGASAFLCINLLLPVENGTIMMNGGEVQCTQGESAKFY
jgi:hypothetical protein